MYNEVKRIPSATSAPCSFGAATEAGKRSAAFNSARIPVAAIADVEASTMTHLEADNAASKGTTTSQIAAKDEMPPVLKATTATSQVRESEEKIYAVS